MSVRLTDDHFFQQFYDLSGAPRFRHGRQLFYTQCYFDCVLFVYDLTDATTRSSISTTWVPEVMTHLGDVGAVETEGRLEGHDAHVRSSGVINELRFLWRQALLSHTTVSPLQAFWEGVRLSWRLIRLLLNETGIWTDQTIDLHAERLYLSTSTVPCAIIGMKADLTDIEDLLDEGPRETARNTPHLRLHANSVAHDPRLHSFLRRAGESVKRKKSHTSHKLSHRHTSGHIMLGF